MMSICNPLVTDLKDINPLFVSQRLAGVDQPPPTNAYEEARFRLPYIKDVTPRLRLQGLACYAHMNFYSCGPGPDRPFSYRHSVEENPALFNAAAAANICASLGFVPPVVLHIAAWFRIAKARFGVDPRISDKVFKDTEYRHLWAAHRDYLSRLQAKEASRLAKVAKAPALYRCANDGCEIQASTKRAFRRCGGECLPERKPRYCSVACQRTHWLIHREFCMSDTANDHTEIVDDDGDPDWVDDENFRVPRNTTPAWKGHWDIWADREDAEIFIDIPNDSPFRCGDVMRLKTRTLSPECLKAYRSLWAPVASKRFKSKMRAYVERLAIEPPLNMGYLQER
ncbi:hypothetical protein C8Q77DRAFT_205019 [Trametes polyzona]|nr:hypothetical protein C8Q77DRAFT_205019 [Trametes polyzona]